MKILLTLVALVGCALPHVDPEPRPAIAQVMTLVRVDSECSETNPFNTYVDGTNIPLQEYPDIVWYQPRWGTGVVISERHVLTAEHIVRCPIIPRVAVTFPDGRYQVMAEEHDAVLFGDGTDLSRLEIYSDERFHLYIAPPALSQARSGDVVIQTLHGRIPGELHDIYVDAATRPGDSGAPVYDTAGRLVGLVDAGPDPTRIVRVTPWWLKGT